MRCSCFLPCCVSCGEAADASVPRACRAAQEELQPLPRRRAQQGDECLAPSPLALCACLLPSCPTCSLAAPQRANVLPARAAKRKRNIGVSRPLSQEVVDDSGSDSDKEGVRVMLTIRTQAQAAWHRKRVSHCFVAGPGRWDFWEIWSGCGNFTASVAQAGGVVGPSVDILGSTSVSRLVLDLESPEDVEFMWWLLHEYKPRHVHVGPPCTFWTKMSRFTAIRTQTEWKALRAIASHHLKLAVRIMRRQSSQGRTASFEQPPRCISWRLHCVQDLVELPGWSRYSWPSCAYGHKDPGSGRPFLKRQSFAANVDFTSLQVPCSCPKGSHQRVQGVVQSGERAGLRRTVVSGEYPPMMCDKLASLIV